MWEQYFSKAYDSLPHINLLQKLEPMVVIKLNKNELNLIHNYLTNFKQRTKISSSYSDWYEIVRVESSSVVILGLKIDN